MNARLEHGANEVAARNIEIGEVCRVRFVHVVIAFPDGWAGGGNNRQEKTRGRSSRRYVRDTEETVSVYRVEDSVLWFSSGQSGRIGWGVFDSEHLHATRMADFSDSLEP